MSLAFFRKGEPEATASGPRKARPTRGLVLGAGVARGWAHIGALRELADMGIVPDIVVGASIGAVVGGCFCAGRLDGLEEFARSLTKRNVFNLLDFSFSGAGLIGGDRLRARLEAALGAQSIETLPTRFVCVATEIATGHEVWLRNGRVVDAMRASYALPGIFEPVRIGGRWLFDGAIVNPVPVNVARAFGADRVIALAIGGDSTSGGATIHDPTSLDDLVDAALLPEPAPEVAHGWRRRALWMRRALTPRGPQAPGLAAVMVNTINITQDRIMRSRLAGDPPDLLVTIKANKIGLFEFHRADELIAIGRACVRRAREEICEQIELVAKT
jgi:NTE family protein